MAKFILLAICVIVPMLCRSRAEISPRPNPAGSRRSMRRGIQVAGGQIDKAGLLQIGESGF